jgi:hypothetical protein
LKWRVKIDREALFAALRTIIIVGIGISAGLFVTPLFSWPFFRDTIVIFLFAERMFFIERRGIN